MHFICMVSLYGMLEVQDNERSFDKSYKIYLQDVDTMKVIELMNEVRVRMPQAELWTNLEESKLYNELNKFFLNCVRIQKERYKVLPGAYVYEYNKLIVPCNVKLAEFEVVDLKSRSAQIKLTHDMVRSLVVYSCNLAYPLPSKGFYTRKELGHRKHCFPLFYPYSVSINGETFDLSGRNYSFNSLNSSIKYAEMMADDMRMSIGQTFGFLIALSSVELAKIQPTITSYPSVDVKMYSLNFGYENAQNTYIYNPTEELSHSRFDPNSVCELFFRTTQIGLGGQFLYGTDAYSLGGKVIFFRVGHYRYYFKKKTTLSQELVEEISKRFDSYMRKQKKHFKLGGRKLRISSCGSFDTPIYQLYEEIDLHIMLNGM